MKTVTHALHTTALILGSALLHIAPVMALVAIAAGNDVQRALGGVSLLCTAAALGYLHGLNRTFDR